MNSVIVHRKRGLPTLLISSALVLFTLFGGYFVAWSPFVPNRDNTVVKGLELLDADEVLGGLPAHHSRLWWRLNLRTIALSLEQMPLIKRAALASDLSVWSHSFSIEIQERRPYLRFESEGQKWLVSDDGVFLTPVPTTVESSADKGQEVQELNNSHVRAEDGSWLEQLVLFRESEAGMTSPDLLHSRLGFVVSALRVIKQELAFRPVELVSRGDGRLEANFAELPFRVVFGFPSSVSSGLVMVAPIEEQIYRFSRMLSLQGKELFERAELIDFGFNKLAVIEYRK